MPHDDLDKLRSRRISEITRAIADDERVLARLAPKKPGKKHSQVSGEYVNIHYSTEDYPPGYYEASNRLKQLAKELNLLKSQEMEAANRAAKRARKYRFLINSCFIGILVALYFLFFS